MNTECIGKIITQNFWSSSRRRLPKKESLNPLGPYLRRQALCHPGKQKGDGVVTFECTLLLSSLVLLSSFPLQVAANTSILLSCHHSNLVCEIILKIPDRLLIQGQKMTFRFYFKAVSSTSKNWDVDLNVCVMNWGSTFRKGVGKEFRMGHWRKTSMM